MSDQDVPKMAPKVNLPFPVAHGAMLDGKRIKRAIWGGYWEYVQDAYVNHENGGCRVQGGLILAHLRDGNVAVAQPYQQDLLADDWQIID